MFQNIVFSLNGGQGKELCEGEGYHMIESKQKSGFLSSNIPRSKINFSPTGLYTGKIYNYHNKKYGCIGKVRENLYELSKEQYDKIPNKKHASVWLPKFICITDDEDSQKILEKYAIRIFDNAYYLTELISENIKNCETFEISGQSDAYIVVDDFDKLSKIRSYIVHTKNGKTTYWKGIRFDYNHMIKYDGEPPKNFYHCDNYIYA